MRYRFRESALGASSTTPRARPQLSDARASSDTPVSRTALLPLGALAGALAALSGPHEGRSLAVRAREQEGSASPRSVPAGARERACPAAHVPDPRPLTRLWMTVSVPPLLVLGSHADFSD